MNEIVLRGKYAKYIKELTSDTPNHPKYFSTYYSAYLFSILYGLINNEREEFNPSIDSIDGEEPATIKYEVIVRSAGKQRYDLIRKIAILQDPSNPQTFHEKLDRALRFDFEPDDSTPDELKDMSQYARNTETVNQYALGGLRLIYNQLSEKSSREDIIQYMRRFKDKYENNMQ